MSTTWRIGSVNGALLAAYFIPAWTVVAFDIMTAPVHALYEQPSISVALFISDHLHLTGVATVRFAWLLVVARLTVAGFFALFLAGLARPAVRRSGAADEALAMALGLGSLVSFASMAMASQVGEIGALRLHAAELLMLLGTAIVMVVEAPAPGRAGHKAAAGDLSLQQP